MYTVICASDEQINKFYEKHVKPTFGFKIFGTPIGIDKIRKYSLSYSYESEDDIGFMSVKTITGKKISCQIRNGEPMYVELTGFGNIRYDIAYPKEHNAEFYSVLKSLCKEASDNFWKGGEI